MKQPIAGVAPPSLGETTVMTVWPTIAATPLGRTVGSMCMVGGQRNPFAIGKLFCLFPGIPLAILLFVVSLAPPIPFVGMTYNRRYRLTNRRVVELHERLAIGWYQLLGISIPFFRGVTEEAKSVALDQFDTIDVEVLPGQEWFPAGELIFKQGPIEKLRLSGVSRPETFKQTCLKARQAYVGVKKSAGV